MKKSLIMLTLVGTIMASSTVAFGYDSTSADYTAEIMASIETPSEEPKDTKPAEEKKPTINEEEDTEKSDKKKQSISNSKVEDEKTPKQDEKKPTLNETDDKKQDTKTPETKDENSSGKSRKKPGCENKANPQDQNNRTKEKKAE